MLHRVSKVQSIIVAAPCRCGIAVCTVEASALFSMAAAPKCCSICSLAVFAVVPSALAFVVVVLLLLVLVLVLVVVVVLSLFLSVFL